MYFLTIAFPTPFKHTLNNILFIIIYRSAGFQLVNQRKSLPDIRYEIWHPILGNLGLFSATSKYFRWWDSTDHVITVRENKT